MEMHNAVQKVKEMVQQPIREGHYTKMVEQNTAKLPSLFYFNLGVISILISATLAIFSRRKEYANFVGLWAPTFFLIGIYNKLVKMEEQKITS